MSDFMKEVEKELDKQIAERFGNIAFVKAKSIEELQASAKRLCTKFDELKIQRNRLLQKVQQLEKENAELKSIIKELISAIDEQSSFCTTCQDEFGTLACSECPWAQAKVKAIRLLVKEESE